MRKHNKKFAQRWTRGKGDRSNFPQVMAHGFVKGTTNQLFSNSLLLGLLFSLDGITIKGTTRRGTV